MTGRASGNLLWAVNDFGGVTHVEDAARGLTSLRCPTCGDLVVAKQGDLLGWHYAHLGDAPCQNAAESALHKAAKAILPDIGAMNMGAALDGPKARVPFELVGIEQRIGRYVADAVIRNGTGDIAIEFVVTHEASQDKVTAWREAGQGAMEIYICDLAGGSRQDVVDGIALISPRRWLSFPRRDAWQ